MANVQKMTERTDTATFETTARGRSVAVIQSPVLGTGMAIVHRKAGNKEVQLRERLFCKRKLFGLKQTNRLVG